MMLAAMLKPRALATSFAVVPSEHFFQRSGKKRLSIVNATATTPAVEEGSRHRDEGIQRLTIVQPDDWHLHLRDGEGLTAVAPLRYRKHAIDRTCQVLNHLANSKVCSMV